jgi:hypothetical protein
MLVKSQFRTSRSADPQSIYLDNKNALRGVFY